MSLILRTAPSLLLGLTLACSDSSTQAPETGTDEDASAPTNETSPDASDVDVADASAPIDAAEAGAHVDVATACAAQHACKSSISATACSKELSAHLTSLTEAGSVCATETEMYASFIDCTATEPCDAWPTSNAWPPRCAELDDAFNQHMSAPAGKACASAVGY